MYQLNLKYIAPVMLLLLSACSTTDENLRPIPTLDDTGTYGRLIALPAPKNKITVGVYNYEDQTGQFKPSASTTVQQTLSRAVTQGATSVLVKALHDAGERSWFKVVERSNIQNLLKERQIIREMYQRHEGRVPTTAELPSVLFADMLFEGGVIGYDSNTKTGGAGARYLGIGGSTRYKEDTVTVYLRAVSVKTGEVLMSVTSRNQIASVSLQVDTFRFVSFKNLLEAEAGYTSNEPGLLALEHAIEDGVYSLIMEGMSLGYWEIEDKELQERYLAMYSKNREERNIK
jgi:curli production assembly/transport component CsgG